MPTFYLGPQKDSVGWAGNTGKSELFEQFDILPRGVKRLYWDAPYHYTALPAVEAMAAGFDLREFVSIERARMAEDVRREATRLYGPRHPQAWC